MYTTIHIQGHLHARWKDWLGGLELTNLEDGQARLQGYLPDQSVLVGILNQIHNLNLTLISVSCAPGEMQPADSPTKE